MSKETLNVVLACCMLVVTGTYVWYARKADREYRSTLDGIDGIKQGLFQVRVEPDKRPEWTQEDLPWTDAS